jgi:F0F1-type ATP synthase membrane subunit b/b'
MNRLLRRSSPACTSAELSEAERVLHETEQRLEEVKEHTPEIIALANHLKQRGRENDFEARLRAAFGGTE